MESSKHGNAGGRGNRNAIVVAGVDVGSLYTKVLILDIEENILSYRIIRSGFLYDQAAASCLEGALEGAGIASNRIGYVVSTGYGRARVSFASEHVSEISCHARAAKWLFPEAGTVIDIGGQDSKVIYVADEGQVLNFVMNDKCAAGTGRFLEVMADALSVELGEMGTLAGQSRTAVEVSSQCTVFAESEVISLLTAGTQREDIVAAIHRSIVRRIMAMIGQLGKKERVTMTGGVTKNRGVVRELERSLDTTLLISEEPQVAGALGAALIALSKLSSESKAAPRRGC
jgi:predicted CoA-substrate-specific enzyme activase